MYVLCLLVAFKEKGDCSSTENVQFHTNLENKISIPFNRLCVFIKASDVELIPTLAAPVNSDFF